MELFKLFGRILIDSDEADKSVQKTEGKASQLAKTLGSGITTAAKWGAGLVTAAAGAATAVVGALLQIDEATAEYRENMAKLSAAWQAAGGDADLAKAAYQGLYAVIGDQDTATEAGQLLAKLAKSTQDVAAWTDIAAGVTGAFGDALPINSLIEASNETAKVGTVTGALADALNWAGISEDAFNKKLAACGSEQERSQLITQTLSETYRGAAEAFQASNEQAMKAREAQAQLDEALGRLGGAVSDVKTRLLGEFAPAIAEIVTGFVGFIQGAEGADLALRSALERMVGKLTEMLPSFLDMGVNLLLALVDGISSNAELLAGTAFTVVTTLLDAILSRLPDLLSAGVDLLKHLADGILDYLPGLIGRLPEIIDQLVGFFIDNLPEIVRIGANMIASIAAGLAEALPDLLAKVPGWIADLAGALLDCLPDIKEAGERIMESLWDGLAEIWDGIVSWVSDKVDWIADKLMFWRSAEDEMSRGGGRSDGSHASGLPYVPYDGYRATLHKGETILNAANSKSMVEDIVNGLAGVLGGGGSGQAVVVKVYLDKQEIAEGIFDPFNDVSRRRGQPIGAH